MARSRWIPLLAAFFAVGCGDPSDGDLGGGLSPTPGTTTAAESARLPQAPCDLRTLVGRIVDYVPGMPLPPAPAGLTLRPLVTEAAMQSLAAMEADLTGSTAYATVMGQMFVLTRSDADLTEDDLAAIESAGFLDLEYSCPIAATGAATTSGAVAAGSNASTVSSTSTVSTASTVSSTGTPWYMTQTGAASVVPALMAQLEGRAVPHVLVAVVDSGVDPAVARVLDEGCPGSWGYDGQPTVDASGHGSAVAGIVAGASGGLADILSIKVLDENGRGDQVRLAEGLVHGIVSGARIMNLSLAWPKRDDTQAGTLPCYLETALALANLLGVKLYGAAGNQCGDPNGRCGLFYPAEAWSTVNGVEVPLVTSIGGLNPRGAPSYQSAWGRDVWAPSEFICARTSSQASPTGYLFQSGTSFAAPQVSGTMALLLAWAASPASLRNPDGPCTIEELEQVLFSAGATTENQDPNAWYTSGGEAYYGPVYGVEYSRLDLCAVMAALGEPVEGCTSWTGDATDQAGAACAVSSGEGEVTLPDAWYNLFDGGTDISVDPDYPPTTAFVTAESIGAPQPSDQGVEAVWCGGLSSAPGSNPCASCGFNACSSGDSTSSGTQKSGPVEEDDGATGSTTLVLKLQLGRDAARYQDYQLKVVRRDGTWAILPIAGLEGVGSGTYRVKLQVAGEAIDPLDVLLIARDPADGESREWSGSMMSRDASLTCD